MLFRLRSDWQNIIKRAWSVRLMLLSAVLSGTATGLTIAQPYLGVNPLSVAGIVGIATTTASLIAIYARLVKQQGI
jgi:hypothetical protein